jgi:alcohol dehydrogenase
MPVVLERDRERRMKRLGAALSDTLAERRRPARARMRALAAAPGARLRWRTVPVPPDPGPRGAIVHPIAMATCDIDCPLVLGVTPITLPLRLGHECVAEVLAVGEQVRDVSPGDRVIVPFQISCGECAPCRAGRSGSCASVPPLSMYGMGLLTGHHGGAFAEQLAVPYADAMLVPLPEGIDPVGAASVSDNVCDAYRHVGTHLPRLLETDPDAEVLIVAGLSRRPKFTASCPLYTGLIARALGARSVVLADSRPDVRAHAESLGLTAITPRELRRHPPARLVAHVSDAPLSIALDRTAADGICSSSGGFHAHTAIPMVKMWMRRVTLYVSIPHVRETIPPVLELMRTGAFRPQDVVTAVAPFDQAPQRLREHVLAGATKTVLLA